MLKVDALALLESRVETTSRIILTAPLLTRFLRTYYNASTICVEFFTEFYIMSQACIEFFQNWSGQNRTSRTASAGPVCFNLPSICKAKLPKNTLSTGSILELLK